MSEKYDGMCKGYIKDGCTKAYVKSYVSCHRGVPKGKIKGKIEAYNGRDLCKYYFHSDSPYICNTIRHDSVRSANTMFYHVDLYDASSKSLTKECTLVITSCKIDRKKWLGTLSVYYPDSKKLFISGYFYGKVKVYRSTLCQPLLEE